MGQIMRPKMSRLIRAAELYYERNLSQREIANILGTSRSKVSRLLAEAREVGIVEITINRPIEKMPELSEEIRKAFNLRDVVVVAAGETYLDSLRNVAKAASELLLSIIERDITIGITFGQTLYHTVQALDETPVEGVEIVQMVGALGEGDSQIDGPEIALRMAERLHGTYRYVHAPAVVESQEIRDVLMQLPQIQETMNRAANADIMIQGIGSLAEEMSSLERAGYISSEERLMYQEQGAVGHLVAKLIDGQGNEISSFNNRVVAMPFEYMRIAKWSIGVSASPLKASAVLAAIRGSYFNTLVIDDKSAHEVLHLIDSE
ncbi:MAG: hypothetical protein DWQ04_16250 [Chloroflexi bacterium]|nr:MAG: hypothetical protein DWQ04_16250 [Chloroflexota bacterium]